MTTLRTTLLALALLATACGGDADADETTAVGQEATTTTTSAPAEESTDDEGSDHDDEGHDDEEHADEEHEDRDHGHEDEGHEHEDEGHEHEHEDGETDHDEPADTDDTEDATDDCPRCPSDEARAVVEEIVAAYNTHDWETFTTTLGTTEPTWDAVIGQAERIHIEADMRWAAALDETWTLGTCLDVGGFIDCSLVVEDAVHRAFVDWGLEPSACRLHVEVDGEVPVVRRYDISVCFGEYDFAFHQFGAWYAENHPGEEPIQGVHYRAWNQFNETAPARAAAALPAFVEFANASE